MGHSSIRIKVRRRKVAHLAANSRKYTVKNCTIPKADPSTIIDIETSWGTVKGTKGGGWNIPKEGYPQCKSLRKRCKGEKWINGVLKTWDYPSEYPDFTKRHWKTKYGIAARMEAYVQDKLKKWEKKNPQPCPDDDLFKVEYQTKWYADRDKALERIRDFVVSIYDKLHVVGNQVDRKNGKMIGKTVAKVKDVDGKGHNVNYPNLQESDQLYKNATKAAQDAMNKDSSIMDCDLKNHKGNQKRPLIHAKRGEAKTQTLKQHKKMQKSRIMLSKASA